MEPEKNKFNETRLASILNNIVDAIVTIDDNGLIESFNKGAENLFGYLEHEVTGKNVKILMPEPYNSHHDGYIGSYIETGIEKVIGKGRDNLEGKRKDGSIFSMYLAINQMWFGNKRMFTGIISDITKRKNYEEELKVAKEAAEHAAKTKERFLSVMNQKIKAPVNEIVAMVKLLNKTDLENGQKEYVTNVNNAGTKLLNIINNDLEFARAESDSLDQTTILVVDDSKDSRLLICHILRKAGYHILEAASGEEALKLVLLTLPDLILLDIVMPGIDGYETCAELKKAERTKDVPLIFLSARTETADKVKGLEIGAVDYIIKPFNKNEILARVNNQVQIKKLTNSLVQTNLELNERRKHLDADLMAAAEIQRSLLPSSFNTDKNIDIAWKFEPCEHMGGDIFNLIQLDDDHLAVYMLDVCGHGVPAAMVTVSVYQFLQPYTGHLIKKKNGVTPDHIIVSPADVMYALDDEFPFDRFNNFFTIAYIIINTRTGGLRYSNAGHPPPVLLRKNGELELLSTAGPCIGMGKFELIDEENSRFEEGKLKMNPGDKLFVYTDGITEYQNQENQLYGNDRFFDNLKALADHQVNDIVEKSINSLMDYGGNLKPQDDITLLGLEIKETTT